MVLEEKKRGEVFFVQKGNLKIKKKEKRMMLGVREIEEREVK